MSFRVTNSVRPKVFHRSLSKGSNVRVRLEDRWTADCAHYKGVGIITLISESQRRLTNLAERRRGAGAFGRRGKLDAFRNALASVEPRTGSARENQDLAASPLDPSGRIVIRFSLWLEGGGSGPAPSPLFCPRRPSTVTVPEPNGAHDLTKADLEAFPRCASPRATAKPGHRGRGSVAVVRTDRSCWPKLRLGRRRREKTGPGRPDIISAGVHLESLHRDGGEAVGEQGKLDLDRDVNESLDFDIPKTFPEPVTLRRLLTHTAGFEEVLRTYSCRAPRG